MVGNALRSSKYLAIESIDKLWDYQSLSAIHSITALTYLRTHAKDTICNLFTHFNLRSVLLHASYTAWYRIAGLTVSTLAIL